MNPALAALAKLKQQKAAAETLPTAEAAPPVAAPVNVGAKPGAIVPPDAPSDLPAAKTDWPAEAKHAYEERAGIREHDGKQPRMIAEAAAEKEVRTNAKRAPKAAAAPDALPFQATPALNVEDPRVEAPPEVKAEVKAPEVKAPEVKAPEVKAEVKAPSPLVLYIDCYPQRGVRDVVPLEDYIAEFQRKVAAQAGVALYSLVEYGKGPALVAAKLAEAVPSGPVYVNSRLPASNACLEVLLPYASTVIRGH